MQILNSCYMINDYNNLSKMQFNSLSKMSVKLTFFSLLISSFLGTITITSNGTDLTAACATSPAWKLNLCNLTCSTCVSTDNNKCSSCNPNYYLSNDSCLLSNQSNYYYYRSYLNTPILTSKDYTPFTTISTLRPMDASDTVYICSNYSYGFQMLGLFANTNSIQLDLDFKETMQEFIVKLNLLVLVNNSQLTVSCNLDQRNVVHNYTYNTISDAMATYAPSTDSNIPNHLNIPALATSNARTMIQKVSIDDLVRSKTLSIVLSCISPNQSTPFWAVSDVVVVGVQCNTCITTGLQSSVTRVGFAVVYILCVVVALFALFLCMIKVNECRKENRMMEKMSGAKDLMPVKAINRVIANMYGKNKPNEEGRFRRTTKSYRSTLIKTNQ